MECSSDEEETASLLAWMSAKNEVLEEDVDDDFDDFDDDEFVPRPESMRPQTQEKSGSFRVRADFLTPVTDFGELCEEDEVVFAARRNEDFGDSRSPARDKIDKKRLEFDGANASERAMENLSVNDREETVYMRENNRRARAFEECEREANDDDDDVELRIPEAKPVGSYAMTSFEKKTLGLRADDDDLLEIAVARAMERASTPLQQQQQQKKRGKMGTTLTPQTTTTTTLNVSSRNSSRKDFRALKNVANIRESARRVQLWFRSLGIELNENIVNSEESYNNGTIELSEDTKSIDRFAQALTKVAMDGSLLKEVVESAADTKISHSSIDSSSLVETILQYLRTVPGVKPRFLWCETEILVGIDVEATVGLFEDVRSCTRWH